MGTPYQPMTVPEKRGTVVKSDKCLEGVYYVPPFNIKEDDKENDNESEKLNSNAIITNDDLTFKEHISSEGQVSISNGSKGKY